MIPINEVRGSMEKNANVGKKALEFVMRHPILSLGILATPLITRKMIREAYPLHQMKSDRKKIKLMNKQVSLLENMSKKKKAVKKREQKLIVHPLT